MVNAAKKEELIFSSSDDKQNVNCPESEFTNHDNGCNEPEAIDGMQGERSEKKHNDQKTVNGIESEEEEITSNEETKLITHEKEINNKDMVNEKHDIEQGEVTNNNVEKDNAVDSEEEDKNYALIIGDEENTADSDIEENTHVDCPVSDNDNQDDKEKIETELKIVQDETVASSEKLNTDLKESLADTDKLAFDIKKAVDDSDEPLMGSELLKSQDHIAELEEPVAEVNESDAQSKRNQLEKSIESEEIELDKPLSELEESIKDNEKADLEELVAELEESVEDSEKAENISEQKIDQLNVEESGLPEETILVEREGKFELMAINDIVADQDKPKLLDRRDVIEKNKIRKSNIKRLPPLSISPEESRPRSTASGKKPNVIKLEVLRVHSAQIPTNSLLANVKSAPTTFALTSQQKDLIRLKQQQREERRLLELEQERLEKERKKAEAQEAYQAWLLKKLQIMQEKKIKADIVIDSLTEQNTTKNQNAFKEWLKIKREKQKENSIRKQEIHQSSDILPEENQKTFQIWLRRKQQEARALRKISQNELQPVELRRRPHRFPRQT